MKKKYFLTLSLLLLTKLLFAQQNYVAEIRLFAGTFAPNGWAFCDGSELSINDNYTLFALIGTTYGGDGVNTFKLPDLRGRVPIGIGQAPGLSNRVLGEQSGRNSVTLTTANMPMHSHNVIVTVSNENATTSVPTSTSSVATSGIFSGRTFVSNYGYNANLADVTLQTVTSDPAGNSAPMPLSRPNLGLNYIIALYGIFPTSN